MKLINTKLWAKCQWPCLWKLSTLLQTILFYFYYLYSILYFGNPPQYSCLENPRNRGAWWAAVYGVAQSRTQLKQLSMHACIGEGNGNPLLYSCLENPRNRGAWWAAVYGVTQSRIRLKQLSSSSSILLEFQLYLPIPFLFMTTFDF